MNEGIEAVRVVVVEPSRFHWFFLGAVVGYAFGLALCFAFGIRGFRRP